MLQHRLGLESRATKDLDGIVRGDIGSDLPLPEAIDLLNGWLEEIECV